MPRHSYTLAQLPKQIPVPAARTPRKDIIRNPKYVQLSSPTDGMILFRLICLFLVTLNARILKI